MTWHNAARKLTGEYYLAGDEYQQRDFRFNHLVNQARKQLWLVRRQNCVLENQALQSNGKLDIAAGDDVLNFKIDELHLIAVDVGTRRVSSAFLQNVGCGSVGNSRPGGS